MNYPEFYVPYDAVRKGGGRAGNRSNLGNQTRRKAQSFRLLSRCLVKVSWFT